MPSGVDGLTIWNVKMQTPTLAALANPAGNGNLPPDGQTFNANDVLDCGKAFVDFPGIGRPNPFGSTWAPSL